MTANERKFYPSYFHKLGDQYNNTYHHSTNKITINTDFSDVTQKNEMNSKVTKFKVNGKVRITKYKNIFSKVYTQNWSREIFIIDSVLKINPWTYRIKDLN